MPSTLSTICALVSFAAGQVFAAAITARQAPAGYSYPFSELVAFGDEHSDNGNGSVAHGLTLTGNNPWIYGYRTWTGGPVAVSYLADLLNVPLTDYAFGGSNGGADSGATCNNNYSKAHASLLDGQPVPSTRQQIVNATKNNPATVKKSVAVLWVGMNEISAVSSMWWPTNPEKQGYAKGMASRITRQANYLVEKGAQYVLVPNIYPKQRSPLTPAYLCTGKDANGPSIEDCTNNFQTIIESTNAELKTKLAQSKHADRIIYFDMYGFLTNIMDNKDQYGFTGSLDDYCDGDPESPLSRWDECRSVLPAESWIGSKPYFWFTFTAMTTYVHKLIAAEMKKSIDAFVGLR